MTKYFLFWISLIFCYIFSDLNSNISTLTLQIFCQPIVFDYKDQVFSRYQTDRKRWLATRYSLKNLCHIVFFDIMTHILLTYFIWLTINLLTLNNFKLKCFALNFVAYNTSVIAEITSVNKYSLCTLSKVNPGFCI